MEADRQESHKDRDSQSGQMSRLRDEVRELTQQRNSLELKVHQAETVSERGVG